MFSINVVTAKGTDVGQFECIQNRCTIGKDGDNLVVLRGFKVAKLHAVLEKRPDGLFLTDRDSFSGTRVNGSKVSEYGPVMASDRIQIGDYLLTVKSNGDGRSIAAASSSPALATTHAAAPAEPVKAPEKDVSAESVEGPKLSAEDKERIRLQNEWRRRLHIDLLKQMDLRRLNVNDMSDDQLREQSKALLEQIVSQLRLPAEINTADLVREVLDETVGLGPLESLLSDPDVSEIMVNSHDQIFYEKAGRLFLSDVVFSDDQAVLGAIERIVTPIGRRIDESSPMVDARLRDGSRVNAVIPPLALKGPCITIRKFMQNRLEVDDLIRFGAMNSAMAEFLSVAVIQKRNIVISGGTGSGKTTLLNVLSGFIPKGERIITVEDAAELKLTQPNLVSLEARPANQEGKGAVEIRDLVKNCLRMRPDRVVVGECRGGEALDMLQAMNTGHDGSLTTAHANSPRDCISRLEVMVMMAGMDLPIMAIREQIASAVQLIVQQSRFSDGSRRITSISEVTGMEGSIVQLNEIFKYQQTGFDEDGKVLGYFTATGAIPEFYEQLKQRGISSRLDIFTKEQHKDD
ncbi:ATPase, T2SS/T4P/T4SS family [Alkalimonas sp. NCh-2]|uniref:ATPase, T2SS/T4P/T4SS family n=1 Tax=Alkalimonas sp. NCh-2 TaxID=3144846 RepID=UPI0031F65935